jgi:hypothetical protein
MPTVRLSDHASFWEEGFRAVMITDSAFYRNPHYHQVTDTMDMLDCRFMAELVESLVTFLVQHRCVDRSRLALEPTHNQLERGRRFFTVEGYFSAISCRRLRSMASRSSSSTAGRDFLK